MPNTGHSRLTEVTNRGRRNRINIIRAIATNTSGKSMWHLIEDFFEQNLVMKGFIGLGWLCVIIMVFSLGDHVWREYKTASEATAAEASAAVVTPAQRRIG